MSDKEFADYKIGANRVHNSQHALDGSFRRFITTLSGIEFVVPSGFPVDQIEFMAKTLDTCGEANFAAGKKVAQKEIREALGIKNS